MGKEKVEETVSEKKAEKYLLEELASHCESVFGISAPAFAGVVASLDKAKKDYTIEEMKKIVSKWLAKEVK